VVFKIRWTCDQTCAVEDIRDADGRLQLAVMDFPAVRRDHQAESDNCETAHQTEATGGLGADAAGPPQLDQGRNAGSSRERGAPPSPTRWWAFIVSLGNPGLLESTAIEPAPLK